MNKNKSDSNDTFLIKLSFKKLNIETNNIEL